MLLKYNIANYMCVDMFSNINNKTILTILAYLFLI